MKLEVRFTSCRSFIFPLGNPSLLVEGLGLASMGRRMDRLTAPSLTSTLRLTLIQRPSLNLTPDVRGCGSALPSQVEDWPVVLIDEN